MKEEESKEQASLGSNVLFIHFFFFVRCWYFCIPSSLAIAT